MNHSQHFSEHRQRELAIALIKSDYKAFNRLPETEEYSIQDLDKIVGGAIDLMRTNGLRIHSSTIDHWIENLNSWGHDY